MQYLPVDCRVSENLSERVVRLELDFAMAKMLKYKELVKHHRACVNHSVAVAKVVIKEHGLAASYI